tara:strand:- start:3047 stop:3790 length:744 start_codon:yes stop_codon:yes gene_type:complete
MDSHWINIEGELIKVEDTPLLLNELELIPLFLRRFLEKKFIQDISPSKEEQIQYYQQFLTREKITDKDTLNNWLKLNDIKESSLELKIYNSLKLEQFKEKNFGNKIEKLFLDKKSDLDRVTYSLIRAKSREKIFELNLRLKEGESTFPDLSSQFSEGVENVFHGLIGPMELGKVNPFIAERLKASKPGQLWPPFECEGWWVILRHERLIPASLNNAMRIRLLNEMYEVWITNKIKKALDSLEQSIKG